MRIDIPEGEDRFLYVANRVGSPRLNKRQADDWDGQYYNDSTLTPREREVARARAAHDVGCTSCVAFRAARDLPGYSDEPIPEDLYEHIFEHETWPGYTERERLVIEFTGRYSEDHRVLAADDALWARLNEHFSDVELADLCLLCGTWASAARMYDLLVGIGEACAVEESR